jgi:hypothetical protein
LSTSLLRAHDSFERFRSGCGRAGLPLRRRREAAETFRHADQQDQVTILFARNSRARILEHVMADPELRDPCAEAAP